MSGGAALKVVPPRYNFTCDWFSAHAPHWETILRNLRPTYVGIIDRKPAARRESERPVPNEGPGRTSCSCTTYLSTRLQAGATLG